MKMATFAFSHDSVESEPLPKVKVWRNKLITNNKLSYDDNSIIYKFYNNASTM